MTHISMRILRFSWAVLFLWFGTQQLMDPAVWVGFLPAWTGFLPIPAETLIQLNGWFECIAAVFLLVGIWIKPVSLILAAHLFFVAVDVGGATGVRDAVLAMVGVALFFAPVDSWALDARGKTT